MQMTTTHQVLKAIALSIFAMAAILSVQAQPKDNGGNNKDYLLKSNSVPAKDSLDATEEKPVSGGAGSVMAKYGRSNQLYANMVDSLSKVLFRYPLVDSAGLTYAEEWVGTPNMGLRRPNYVIIHHTANNSCEETLREFTRTGGREASAHYVICKDGTVHHMLNDLLRSHHAGESKWNRDRQQRVRSIYR
jgi:hypothetical protein